MRKSYTAQPKQARMTRTPDGRSIPVFEDAPGPGEKWGVPSEPGRRQIEVEVAPPSWGVPDQRLQMERLGYKVDEKLSDNFYIMSIEQDKYEERQRQEKEAGRLAARAQKEAPSSDLFIQKDEVQKRSLEDLQENVEAKARLKAEAV